MVWLAYEFMDRVDALLRKAFIGKKNSLVHILSGHVNTWQKFLLCHRIFFIRQDVHYSSRDNVSLRIIIMSHVHFVSIFLWTVRLSTIYTKHWTGTFSSLDSLFATFVWDSSPVQWCAVNVSSSQRNGKSLIIPLATVNYTKTILHRALCVLL